MSDTMLDALYFRCFKAQKEANIIGDGESFDKKRHDAQIKNILLSELIDIRTQQIREAK